MKFHWFSSKTRWKDSVTISLAILSTSLTVAEISGIMDLKPVESLCWWMKLIWIFVLFLVLTILTFVVILLVSRKGIKLNVGDNEIHFKKADIFKQDGLRLIPFNEYFDIQVDDVIIAHNTLNGKFIDDYVNDSTVLQDVIRNAPEVRGLSPRVANGKNKYPLGRIIKFNEYLLLAFTHFDDNHSAYLSHTDYEECLIRMWKEIDRVYANNPVYIPLLGSGITRFTDTPHKDNYSLAKCLLCTLKMSGVHLKKPVTICLTEETLNEINIYELKTY